MDLLSEIGTALYGPRWHHELARALGVNRRTVQRWAKGEYEPPQAVWREIADLCRRHSARLAKIAERL